MAVVVTPTCQTIEIKHLFRCKKRKEELFSIWVFKLVFQENVR